MPISEKGLRNKAKKRELEALQKNKINSELIPTFVELLRDVYTASRPKEIDYHNRNDLVRIFNEIAKEIYEKSDDCPVVEEFGSFSMDLFSNESDLDLSVNFGDNAVDFPREKKIQALRKFAKKFYTLQNADFFPGKVIFQWEEFEERLYVEYAKAAGRGHVSGVQPIFFANVPILKVTDRGTGIECDISIENRDGVVKSKIVHHICSIDERFHMLSFLLHHWQLEAHVFLPKPGEFEAVDAASCGHELLSYSFRVFPDTPYKTKAWAKAHGINSSKDRTLNSLSIISLVAFHLQNRHPPILPPFSALLKDGPDPSRVQKLVTKFTDYGKENQESVGELFVTLLIKLASVETLWTKGLCASPYEGTWMLKTWENKYAAMSVEDFTDQSQNVARAVGSGEVKKIYQCIQFSLKYIFSFMDGKIQTKKLRDILFGREGVVGSVRSNGSLEGMQPIPFTAILQKLDAMYNTTSPEVVWGGAPIEGWPSGNSLATGEGKQNNNLEGNQTSNSGNRIFQPCENSDPVMKKMRRDECLKGTIMQPIPFTAVLKTIAGINTSTTPEVVWGGTTIDGRPSGNSPATGAGKQHDNLVGEQTSNFGKRTFHPYDNVNPMMTKMHNDGCFEGTTMQPVPFTAVLKTIAGINTSNSTEVVRGGAPTEGWPSGNSH